MKIRINMRTRAAVVLRASLARRQVSKGWRKVSSLHHILQVTFLEQRTVVREYILSYKMTKKSYQSMASLSTSTQVLTCKFGMLHLLWWKMLQIIVALKIPSKNLEISMSRNKTQITWKILSNKKMLFIIESKMNLRESKKCKSTSV